jgi:hypothetical protein
MTTLQAFVLGIVVALMPSVLFMAWLVVRESLYSRRRRQGVRRSWTSGQKIGGGPVPHP